MKSVPFSKVQTVGNDFVLVHKADIEGMDRAKLAIHLCDRRRSVGSDGLLITHASDDRLYLTFYNPDGSEDFCGNGLRCASMHAYRQGWFGESFWVEQNGFSVPVEISGDEVTATMPWATSDPSRVPVISAEEWWERPVHGLVGSAVSTGSTHFVAFVDELPGDEEFQRVSRQIETDPLFPERTSIMWTKVLADNTLEIRIWERAIGETLGCGTGASAAAAVWARKSGQTGVFVVKSKGGDLKIELNGWNGPIKATSTPQHVFFGVACVPDSVSS